MECVICNELTLKKETKEHIANIKIKRLNIEKEIIRIFDSDPELAKKLKIKLLNYENEIKQLEKDSFAANAKLCENCSQKMEDVIINCISKYKENLKIKNVVEDYPYYYSFIHAIGELIYKIRQEISKNNKNYLSDN